MIRVLVVDDDFMVARLHSALVEQLSGFTVAKAVHNGADALAAVRELRPELVLLDMYLPDIPGLEVLRELRGEAAQEQGPDVLVVTAARDAETVRGARRGGAVQYIIKPFEGRLLQERLRLYARQRAVLDGLKAPGQDDVDRLFADAGGGAAGGSASGSAHVGAAGATDGQGSPAGTYGTGQARPSRLPKGLTEQTSALVRSTLDASADGSGLSASECAERSGLSRVSARRYLEHFVSLGTARVTLRYGTTGRPERRYHRAENPAPPPPYGDRPAGKHVIPTADNS